MLKFFRKIREDTILNGRSSRYFKYAIGEIILVVIGILIALQINNWNENRKAFNKSEIYLNETLKDLEADTVAINGSILYTTEYLKNDKWGLNKTAFTAADADSIWLTFGGFYATLSLNNRTFLKIQNAGESNLVGFESTYDKISNYYTEAHERYNRFAEWDVYSVTDGQTYLQEIYGQLEISNYRIQLLGRETTTEEFPVIQNSSDQVKKLIDFALSPRGRNHLKNNYVRHMRGLTVLQKTKSEAIDLIQEIKMVLND